MVNTVSSGIAVLTTIFLTFGGDVAAQSLPPEILECRAISNDANRLACLDEVIDRFIETAETESAKSDDYAAAAVAKPAAPIAKPAPEEQVLSEADRFGFEDLPTEKKKELRPETPKALEATVVDIARNRRGKYVVILDNGQVWRQLNADTNKLRVPTDSAGMKVEIKRKWLGAHDLRLENSKRTIRVERIK
ncbi:MAG: hypothetical protein ACE5FO_12535 [Parvularculaceae bacterium]